MLFLLVTAALAQPPTHAQMKAASWTQTATKTHAHVDGEIKISEGSVGGVACFRAEGKTKSSPAKLLEVAADVEGAKRWSSAGVTQAELLKSSGGTIEYFQYLDVPSWTMAADRFWFLSATVKSSSTKASMEWKRLENGGANKAKFDKVKAENAGAVEPPINVGGWYFEGKGDHTQVTYMICTDSGGSIPHMIQKAATQKTLPDNIGDLTKEAAKR